MYQTSQTWNSLMVNPTHSFEPRVDINGVTYLKDVIVEMNISLEAFAESQPSVGGCIAGELNLTMLTPSENIPRMAEVRPYVRVVGTVASGTNATVTGTNLSLSGFVEVTGTDLEFQDGTNASVSGTSLVLSNQRGELESEWIPQGVFYIDTREFSKADNRIDTLTIHAYDAMLMTEQEYPDTTHPWPMYDDEVVDEIAQALGVGVDDRTWDVMTRLYRISAPLGYSMREVLGNIAAMYAANFIMNYDGELLLVTVNGIPPETNYLINEEAFAITFGGDRILV